MSTALSSNNNFTDIKKPNFTIEFSAIKVGVEIRINDIPAFTLDNTGFMTLEIPIGEYIINGNNTISVITFPTFDDEDEQSNNYVEGSNIEVAVYVRESGTSKENRQLINKVLITPNNAYLKDKNNEAAIYLENTKNNNPIKISKDDTVLNYPVYGNYKKQVVSTWTINNIQTTYPLWEWQKGKEIPNSDEIYQALVKSYTELHTAFKNKDLSLIKKISKSRSKELSLAYHLKDEEAGFEYSALGKDIDHPTIKLYEHVYLDDTKFDIFGNGKLARIMDGGQNHPVVFMDKITEQLYQPQFIWYLNQNNEWVLIR